MEGVIKEYEEVLCGDLANWMKNLPPNLRATPLIHLAVPGSHDSMTSSITYHSKLAPDAETILKRLKFFGPLLRLFMSRWSKTQDYDVLEQLSAGIRYFDLRLATKKCSIYPYFVHGLYAAEAVEILNKVKEFLDAHPMEVVILDFNHFYAFEKQDHDNFIRFLIATFGQKLLPFTINMSHLSLEYMTNKFRYQVIIVYRLHSARHAQPLLWPGMCFPTPWPQTVSKSELIKKLDHGIAHRLQNLGYISQCLLTPTNWFVSKHLFSTLKQQCAEPLEKVKLEWIRRQKIGADGANIIICDFIDKKFCKEVILLNIKDNFKGSSATTGLTPVDSSF